jgi:hypothetical protein
LISPPSDQNTLSTPRAPKRLRTNIAGHLIEKEKEKDKGWQE